MPYNSEMMPISHCTNTYSDTVHTSTNAYKSSHCTNTYSDTVHTSTNVTVTTIVLGDGIGTLNDEASRAEFGIWKEEVSSNSSF